MHQLYRLYGLESSESARAALETLRTDLAQIKNDDDAIDVNPYFISPRR